MNAADASDRALMETFGRTGDARAFDRLYERHTPRLHGLALRLSGSEADAGDIVQETWLRALGRVGSYRGDARFSTWLCGIGVNVWRERTRLPRADRHVDPATDLPDLRTRTAHHDAIDVERALRRLAPGYRAVLVLHAIYGYSHAEIAALLGIQEGTSKSQLARARRALQDALGRTAEESFA